MAYARLFTLMERLGNLTQASLRTAGQLHGLQPVPLLVLSFLAKANRYSDTPAAVADYLGLSRAAISQTLGLLEERGLIERTQDEVDRRVWRLRLTLGGRSVVDDILPPADWSAAVERLGSEEAARLESGLESLLRAMQRANGSRSFGECRSCRHFLSDKGGGNRCGLTQEPLSSSQIVRICREHAFALD